MESVKVTGKEYEEMYFPLGGFLLISKDLAPKKTSGIIVPESVRDEHSKWTPTGTIVRKSLFRQFEDDTEEYIYHLIDEGDRVGYNSTSPFYSPSPLHYIFEGDDRERYVTIHCKDIVCVFLDTEAKRKEYRSRF